MQTTKPQNSGTVNVVGLGFMGVSVIEICEAEEKSVRTGQLVSV